MLFKNLEVILKWITSVIGCLVSFSIVRLLIYYKSFNVQITNYLSFSECILLFTDQLALFLWFVIILFLVYTTLYFIISAFVKGFQYKDLMNMVYHDKKWLRIILVIVFMIPLLYLENAFIDYTYHHAKRASFIAYFICSIIALIYAALFFFKLSKGSLQTRQVSDILTAYLVCVCTICFYTSMLRRQLYLVEVNKLNQQVTCYDLSDKKVVESNFSNNIQYLGSTKEFIIFYDMQSKIAAIYKTASFNRIEFGPANYRQVPGWSIFDILY